MEKFCFVCYTNPTIGHKCKMNYERTGGGTEVACVLCFLVVLFISEVFVTQSSMLLGQQSVPKGGCRGARRSKHICNWNP